jgi:hypothetical protein
MNGSDRGREHHDGLKPRSPCLHEDASFAAPKPAAHRRVRRRRKLDGGQTRSGEVTGQSCGNAVSGPGQLRRWLAGSQILAGGKRIPESDLLRVHVSIRRLQRLENGILPALPRAVARPIEARRLAGAPAPRPTKRGSWISTKG